MTTAPAPAQPEPGEPTDRAGPGLPETTAAPAEDEGGDGLLTGLILRIGQGDDRALADLCHASLSAVLALALQLGLDGMAAEALAEDLYFEVWRRAIAYDAEQARPLAWLGALLRRLASQAGAARA